jgi:large conductance mechanosensitive channel
MLKDFRAFLMRGNVIDMAVGIIIGAAFGPIVNSMVKDVIMPPIGLALGKVDFSNMFVVLRDGKTPGPYASLTAAQTAGAVSINYGFFVNTIVSFLIVAAVVFFFIVRPIAKLNARQEAKKPAAAPTTRDCPYCLTKINVAATRCPNCTSQLTAAK